MRGEEDIDYSHLTVDELEDVGRHVDRVAYPDVANRIDAEMRRRRAAGEIVTAVFSGGGRVGASGMNYSWPMVTLRFTRNGMTLRTTFFGIPAGEVTLAREDVTGFRRIRGWFGGGFEILHGRRDVPGPLVFRPWSERRVLDALHAYGWPVT